VNRPHSSVTFNAYSGTADGPRVRRAGAVPLQNSTERRSRRWRSWWLLLIIGLAGSGVAVHHYAAPLQVHMKLGDIEWPAAPWREWQLPALDEEWLNRPIRTVRIDSPVTQISEADIRGVLARHMDGGFFSMDVRQIKDELEDNPWVAHASVRRVWPDILAVTVVEHRAIARWGDDELLNQRAERFVPPSVGSISGLPRLDGPADSAAQVMRQYQQFSQLLQPTGLRISALSVNTLGSWSMVVNEGVVINVGRDHLVERLQRMIALYEGALHEQMNQISVIDLRYRNGIAVRERQPESDEVAVL